MLGVLASSPARKGGHRASSQRRIARRGRGSMVSLSCLFLAGRMATRRLWGGAIWCRRRIVDIGRCRLVRIRWSRRWSFCARLAQRFGLLLWWFTNEW